MIDIPVKYGSIGLNISISDSIILKVMDEEGNQVRVSLDKNDAEYVINRLTELWKELTTEDHLTDTTGMTSDERGWIG